MNMRRNRRADKSTGMLGRSLDRSQTAIVSIAATTHPSQHPLSNRHLDFCSLALCSCLLTLLCHSSATPPQTASNANSSTSAVSTPSHGTTPTSPFKLFTLSSFRPETEEEEG
ncbi:MAG: hypothetical protein HC881_23795 [Leptolyngbyaceae cyanobacterium SL_7_1]|nr:hypothetical protein [Leptolyngbyaceae cyanobacterium SL_7_1]